MSFYDDLRAWGKGGLNMAGSLLGQIPAGYAGLYHLAKTGNPYDSADAVESVVSGFQLPPTTMEDEGVNYAMGKIGNLLEPLDRAVDEATNVVNWTPAGLLMSDETKNMNRAFAKGLFEVGVPTFGANRVVQGFKNRGAGTPINTGNIGRQKGVIGGVKAKTANLELLNKAREMKANGVDADTIYDETRWWLDHPDGKPRFEIDDSDYQYNKNNLPLEKINGRMYSVGKINDAVSHEKLNNSYPDLFDAELVHYDFTGDTQGVYRPQSNITPENITLWNPVNKKVPLHEMQHAIQNREKFSSGGNKSMFNEKISNKWLENPEKVKRFKSLQNSKNYLDELGRSNREFKKYENELDYLDELNDSGKISDEDWKIKTQDVFDRFNQWKARNTPTISEVDSLYKELGDGKLSPEKQYLNLSGESEARLVEARMKMPMDARMADPFYKNYDVPFNDMIIIDRDSLGKGKTYQPGLLY